MEHLFDVIAEDGELLVINKPAGLVCHPTKGDVYSSLISRVRLYLKTAETPHMVNRLDRETSGIVLVAKTAESNVRLRKLWESRDVHKEYEAIVHGRLNQPAFIQAPLGPDSNSQVAIKDIVRPDGVAATTQVFPLTTFVRDGMDFSKVRVVLYTGRKHQIRIHLSHIGHPIVGEKLYGGDENLYLSFVKGELTAEQKNRLITEHHCLHARRLSFAQLGVAQNFYCRPEPWFTCFAEKEKLVSGEASFVTAS